MPPDPLRIHPAMAHTYRDRVGALIRGLSDAEAKEALRALVETIMQRPTGRAGLSAASFHD